DDVMLSGGGSHNPVLRKWLAQALRPAQVRTTDEWGIASRATEAVAFAILANETVAGNSSNVPSATGATHPGVLGKLAPALTASNSREHVSARTPHRYLIPSPLVYARVRMA